MASWNTILCCNGLSELLRHAHCGGLPPTPESSKCFDNLLQHGDSLPQQDDPGAPLSPSNYQDAIVSVTRFEDTTDVHWPVRYFAVSALADETMQGSINEIDEKKVQAAEAQGFLQDRDASAVGCWVGDCPEHPNLEFYIRYRPLRDEPLFPSEEGERQTQERRARVGSLTLSELSIGPEDLIRRVEEDDYVPEVEGDFPDGEPLAMVHHPMYPYRGDLQESLTINEANQI